MAYVSTIKNDWHVEVFRRGDGYQIIVNIGHDSDIGHTYSVVVGLDMAPGGYLELYFYLVDADDINVTEECCHCGIQSNKFIPKVQRGAIRRAILHATKSLIGQVNPSVVYWCTWDADLPEKALDKYIEVGRVFTTLGYDVKRGDPYHGRHIWYAERLNDPGFPYDNGGE